MKKYPMVNGKPYIPQSKAIHIDQHKLDIKPIVSIEIKLKDVSRRNKLFSNMGELSTGTEVISHGNSEKSITLKKTI